MEFSRVIMMQLLWCEVALHVIKYLTYQWYTRLTLRTCHGYVCTWLPHSPLAALHVHRIEIPYRAFLERVGPRILSLESVDYFRTSNYSARKKEQSKWGKLRGLPENEDRESGIEDRLKKKWKKKIVDRGDVGRRLYINFKEHNPAHCTESMSIKF